MVPTDDHGLEVLKKAAEEVTPGDKSDYYIKTSIVNFADISVFIDDIESLLTTIRDNADEIEEFLDQVEGLITSTNTILTAISGFTDGIEALLTSIRNNTVQPEFTSWTRTVLTITTSVTEITAASNQTLIRISPLAAGAFHFGPDSGITNTNSEAFDQSTPIQFSTNASVFVKKAAGSGDIVVYKGSKVTL